MSDGTGWVDEACGTSLEVGTVVHDDSLHQLIAHRALDLLFIQQRLLQLLGALGAVAQVFSGSKALVGRCEGGGSILRVTVTHRACWVLSAGLALRHAIDIEEGDSCSQCDPALIQESE